MGGSIIIDISLHMFPTRLVALSPDMTLGVIGRGKWEGPSSVMSRGGWEG